LYKCTARNQVKEALQFPPKAFSGSSNMFADSAGTLLSWVGLLFLDLGGAFFTGFTLFEEKISSVEEKKKSCVIMTIMNKNGFR
jgi:hypothetical protein